MRYTVLTSRTFHNRITKIHGVLVAAALVAVLGLPGAAQAQSIDPTVEFRWRRLRVTWEAARRLTTPTGLTGS